MARRDAYFPLPLVASWIFSPAVLFASEVFIRALASAFLLLIRTASALATDTRQLALWLGCSLLSSSATATFSLPLALATQMSLAFANSAAQPALLAWYSSTTPF